MFMTFHLSEFEEFKVMLKSMEKCQTFSMQQKH